MAAVQLVWCAPASAAAPTVVTRGERICQLTGDAPDGGTRSNWTMTRNGLYGTDLGYTVSYRGLVYFLFGDTWVPTASGGGAAIKPPASDDAMAWTTDTTPDDCLALRSVTPGTSLTAAVTPDESLPAVPLPVGSRWAAITIKDGSGILFFTPALSTPVGGFSANDKIYVLFLVNTLGVYLAASTGTGAGFSGQALVSPSTSKFTGKFINLAAVDNPSDTANIYVIGSPVFTGGPLYLQRHAKGTLAPNGTWQGRYWDGKGWANDETSAVPLGVEAGAKKFEVEPFTQLSVQWVPALARYVMIYGAAAGVDLLGTGTSPGLDLKTDQVFVRTATQLQGPWSAPAAVFGRLSDGGYCNWMRVGTEHPQSTSCGAGGTGQTTPGREKVTGFTYGVSLLPAAFTKADAGIVTLYFAISTFNPYQVMLLKARIKN